MGSFTKNAVAQTVIPNIFFGLYLFWLMFNRISLSVVFPNVSQISLWSPVASICVLAFLVYGFFPQIKIIMQGKIHLFFGVLLAIATLVTSLPIFNQQPLLSYVVVVLIGVSLPWFLLSWMHQLSHLGAVRIIASFIMAGFVAAALFLAVANSSSLVNCAIALISIVASSIFLSTQTNEEPSAKIRVNPQQNIVMSARHMGAITLFAIFALGFFTQLLSIVSLVPSQAQEGTAEGDAAVACATASIILLLGLAVHRLKKTNRFDSLEASLTFCLVFIACAVLATGYSDNNTIFSVVFSSCTRLSFLMVLIVLLISVSNSNSESRPTLCLGLATLYSGYFIGGLLGEMQVSGNDITTALLLALSLLLVALMSVLVRNMKSSIQIAPDCAGSSSAESTLSNYHSFAESQGLTPRQTEVLRWLATGRSSAYIAKQMNISENTAKAHVSKIYERLNVHSRDELLDLLENYTQSDTR